jgi:hypothetical protein
VKPKDHASTVPWEMAKQTVTSLFVHTFRPVSTLRLCQAASGLPAPLRGLTMFRCRSAALLFLGAAVGRHGSSLED